MSLKTMDRIRKFISNNLGEDEMEVDLDFTERYLSQFESIDRQTIEVLIENGYQTKEHLVAFDLQEDLPLLPVLNMAQKSLLRKVLKQFHESEELEVKIYDLKGEDSHSPNVSIIDTVSTANKRKFESSANSSSKRIRSSPEKAVINDGLGTRMRQMVNKRKPIHSNNSQTDSDNEPEFVTTVDSKRFQFGGTNQIGFGYNRNTNQLQDEDYEEDNETYQVSARPLRGGGTRVQILSPVKPQAAEPRRATIGGRRPLPPAQDSDEEEKEEVVENRRLRGRQSLSVLPKPSPSRRVSGIPVNTRKSIASPYVVTVKSESNSTTPKTRNSTASPSTHIPTPTELEVRERLAQKALAKQKSGRKRR